MIRRFWPYVRKQRGLIVASFFALFAEIGLRLLEPWPLKFVFDRVFASHHHHGAATAIPTATILDPLTLIGLAALAVVCITALRAVAAYWNTIGFTLVGNRVLTEVREELYRHLQCLSLSFHNRARSGELTVRVVSDVGLLQDVAVTAFLPLLGKLLLFVCMMTLMCSLSWELGLIGLAMVPLFWVSTTYHGRRIQEVSRRQRQREGAMASTAAESMGAIKAVQALSLEGTFAQVFSRHNRTSLSQDVQGKRLAANLERTVDVLIAIGTALVLWRGGYLVVHERLTPGGLLVLLAYLKSAFKPVQDFAKYIGRLAKASAAGERVLDLLERVPEVRDRPDAVPASHFRGHVGFEHVTFAYDGRRAVLRDITFEVRPGQHIALVGPSGIGKSTLVSLILRLYDPPHGRVLIDGRDIREYTLKSLRAQISVVLQDTFLFAASVRDNIAFGAPNVTAVEIEAAARLASAHDFITALPDGYDTMLGERGVTLSNGQRQRLAVARAAIRRAPILILDEPTTGLDRQNEHAVIQALERLAQGRTTFLVTHALDLAARADHILYLEGGRIVERGTHAELLRANGRYAAIQRLHALRHDRGLHDQERADLIA
jgi:ATP-binding cassette subfamily B protein